jgi:hypothetical protein
MWSNGWLPWGALVENACAWRALFTGATHHPRHLSLFSFAVDATPHRDWQAVAEQREDELAEAHQQLQEMSQASAALEKSLLAELETVSCGVCGQPVRPGFLRHHARAHCALMVGLFFFQPGWVVGPGSTRYPATPGAL